tara:strand:+ start:594 stop:1790 length:1197 start_codon:yes stop_codon:yes gene_type:complete
MGVKIIYLVFVISFLLSFAIVCLMVSSVDSTMNSSTYTNDVVVSSGGGNTSSSNYFNEIISGILSGDVISSTGYKNYMGFYVDIIFPQISISSPVNNVRTDGPTLDIIYSASDVGGVDSCWWTNNTGVSNHTLASCETNIVGVTWDDGVNTIVIYVNDTDNNINSANITFAVTYCGDGTCDAQESCSSCENDCGVCVVGSVVGGEASGGGTVIQPQIDVIINVSSDKLLFDAQVFITDEFKEIYTGENMRSTMNLIPMGIDPDLDVYLRYYILDENGNEVEVGDAESETIRVTDEKSFDKDFFTQTLNPGEYTLNLELKYCAKWISEEKICENERYLYAEAGSQFVVRKGKREEVSYEFPSALAFLRENLTLLILGVGIFVLIVVIIIMIKIKPSKKK